MDNQKSQTVEAVETIRQKLIAKHAVLLNMLTIMLEDLRKHEDRSKTFLEELLDQVKSFWNQIRANHSKICEHVDASTSGCYIEKQMMEAKHKYNDVVRVINQQLESRDQPTTSTPKLATLADSLPLPPIKLPRFSGSYMDWESFNNFFVSMIHQNPSLTNVE